MNVLLIDDNRGIFTIMRENFEFAGHRLHYASCEREAMARIAGSGVDTPDVILLDIKMGRESGLDILSTIKARHPDIPVIMITGYASVETAVAGMKAGAFDYLTKPLDFDLLCRQIEKAGENYRVKLENRELKERLIEDLPAITSRDTEYLKIIERAGTLASSDLSILILGENGTGKELLAELIHRRSERSSRKMHKINCAAFPESLLDNELFGHEKGAYTGADGLFKGIFEQADGGTLFLDEIGDMPPIIQVKLLRVLQNSEIRRIGGDRTINIDVRFIGATNKNLHHLIAAGVFREDLFYRLNTAVLNIPPLRERKGDIELLTSFFLDEFSRKNNQSRKEISPAVSRLFSDYSWPGNVRELKNVLNYAATIGAGSQIQADDLPPYVVSPNAPAAAPDTSGNPLEDQQIEIIRKTLVKCGNNKSRAARILNISRNTLYMKMKKYGIHV